MGELCSDADAMDEQIAPPHDAAMVKGLAGADGSLGEFCGSVATMQR